MSRFGRVALLLGGSSPEREVSLMSGREVSAALSRLGYDVVEFDPGERSLCELRGEGVEAAFVILHGGSGENGVVQGMLEELGVPYTGSGPCACAVAMDKHFAKRIWAAEGLPTPPHRVLADASGPSVEAAAAALGCPMFVKPRSGGSSLATARVESAGALREAVEEALATGDDAMVEPCVSGDEITFSILGGRVLPSIKVSAQGTFYDYEAKYFSDETGYLCPSGLGAGAESDLGALSLKAYEALGCSGWGRVDMIVGADGRPHLLEANTVPGMTTHSLVPMAAKAVGVGFDELVGEIMECARGPE